MRVTKVYSWERVPVIFDMDYACALTGVATRVLQKLCQEGKFPAFKMGRKWMFRKEDIQRWIDQQLQIQEREDDRSWPKVVNQ